MKRQKQQRLQQLRQYRADAIAGWKSAETVFAREGEPWRPPTRTPGSCLRCGHVDADYSVHSCPTCWPEMKSVMQEIAAFDKQAVNDRNRVVDLRRFRQSVFNATLRKEIPPKYRPFWSRRYMPTSDLQEGLHRELTGWASNRQLQQSFPFFYLFGETGTGKTALAVNALSAYSRGKKALGNPTFVSEVEFVERWNRSHSPDSKEKPSDLIDLARTRQLLCWDDLGKSKLSEAWARAVFLIFQYRDDYMLPTLITSNCDPCALITRVGDPTADRVASGVVRELKGKSLRMAA